MIQLNPENVWAQGGEAWIRYEVYKDAENAVSARGKEATDKDLKKLFRKRCHGRTESARGVGIQHGSKRREG